MKILLGKCFVSLCLTFVVADNTAEQSKLKRAENEVFWPGELSVGRAPVIRAVSAPYTFYYNPHIAHHRYQKKTIKNVSELPTFQNIYEAVYNSNYSDLLSTFRRKKSTEAPAPEQECEYPPSSETDLHPMKGRRKRLSTSDNSACLEDYPYTVSIRINGKHWCGGALVASQWVLSAGYCFDGVSIRDVSVRMGSVFRDFGGNIYSITSLKRHPDYHKTEDHNYNLAMIKLNMPVKETVRIRPVSLPTPFSEMSDYPYIGEIVVSGFGSAGSEHMHDGENQELRVMVVSDISDKECQTTYKEEYAVGRSHLCLKSQRPGVALCTGDIGNPAVLFTNSNREGTLVGIAVYSGNEECPEKKRPGVYMKVSHSSLWIQNLIKGSEAKKQNKKNNLIFINAIQAQRDLSKPIYVVT